MNGTSDKRKEAMKESIRLRAEVVRQGLWPSCINCTQWTETTEILMDGDKVKSEKTFHKCNKFRMIPPADTIIVGCIYHEPEVPF